MQKNRFLRCIGAGSSTQVSLLVLRTQRNLSCYRLVTRLSNDNKFLKSKRTFKLVRSLFFLPVSQLKIITEQRFSEYKFLFRHILLQNKFLSENLKGQCQFRLYFYVE